MSRYWCVPVASFDFCIDQAFKDGKITKATANSINESADPEDAINGLVADLTRQKREAAIQAVRLADGWAKVSSHPVSKHDGLISLMVRDQTEKAGYANVDYLAKRNHAKYNSMFADALSRFRTRRIGFEQDEAGLTKLIKAVYGEAVDDPEIEAFARQWADTLEQTRVDFNAKGGSISKNESYLLPQNHDAKAIREMGLDHWKARIMPMLDRSKMTDDLGEQLTDRDFIESLDYVYETITTGGLNKTKDFSVPRLGKKMSRKGSEQRFIYFKDADSWMAYQKEFGKGDIFTTLTDSLEAKANDTAMMEIFGTSPESTYLALKNQIIKEGGLSERQQSLNDAVYNVVSGKTSDGNLTGVADFMQSTRNVLTASTLGGAFLSALSDVGFQGLTSHYNGLMASTVLGRQMKLMSPTKEADRIMAVKIGLGAEAWLGRATGSNRYADIFGTGNTAKLAEGVMRGSLLAPWTDAGRKAFGMEYSSMLADNFGKSFDDLSRHTKRAFEAYGINSNDWDLFRASDTLDFEGARYADLTKEGGKKFNQMIMTETDFAVPTPDAKVRAMTTGGLGRSTVAGQGWRSVMMLKSFPITMMTTHFYRGAYQATAIEKIGYLGTLAATTTIMGAIAVQAKDLASGREPRPVDEKLMAAAFMQGGGLGIFGDFVFSDHNRYGGGFSATAFGVTGQLADTSLKYTIGNVAQAIKGEETNILGETVQLAKRYSPSVWQTRLFTNAIFDQMELLANPNSQRRFNKIVKRRQKNYDQGYWWRPGETTPEALK